MSDIEYFRLNDLVGYRDWIGEKYDSNSVGTKMYFETRDKLKHLGQRLGEAIGVNLRNNYNEKPNKMAGHGQGFVLKEYILTGFVPKDIPIENQVFVKLSFGGFDSQPEFGIDVDVNFSDDENQYKSYRDKFQAEQYWRIPVDSNFPNTWDGLVELISPVFEEQINYVIDFFDQRNDSEMKIIAHFIEWMMYNWKTATVKTHNNYAKNVKAYAESGSFDLDKVNSYDITELSRLAQSLRNNGQEGGKAFSAFVKDLQKKDKQSSDASVLQLNQILFGPPGTGKTYKINELKRGFIDKEELLVDDSLTFDLAQDNSWWKIIAAILYSKGSMKVPDLIDHPMIRAKHNPDKPTKANQIVWSQLQLHTKKENEFVNHTRRHDPLIFDKDKESNWTVDRQLVEEELVEIKSLAEEIENVDKQIGKIKTLERFKFVTFHQSFTYEDFVEGIKPVLTNDEDESSDQDDIAYRIEKGVFYEACQEALRLAGYKSFKGCYEDSHESKVKNFKKAKPYAIFIDEINRGNVSAIFGELITLIEADKRIGQDQELWVNLPYDKSVKFSVPPNLHIIGTMNTADRSIEALDTALRRRFAFEEVKPDIHLLEPHFLLWRLWQKDWDYKWKDEKWILHESSLLKLIGEVKDKKAYEALEKKVDWEEGLKRNVFEGVVEFNKLNPAKLLKAINERIELLIDKDHMIGHSYFFSLIGADDCEKELMSIFYDKIIPLLEEYFYGDFGKIGLVLGRHFVEIRSGAEVKFAAFEMEDQSMLQDKNVYTIKDYRFNKYEVDFMAAVKSIYEIPSDTIKGREEENDG
ncbi:McrB family protein [Ekhidna sp.]|uniref:McrB family protein n=1 Tax=Ekhidna sp. TaxID=2608089 RepID=UPI003CCC3F8C